MLQVIAQVKLSTIWHDGTFKIAVTIQEKVNSIKILAQYIVKNHDKK